MGTPETRCSDRDSERYCRGRKLNFMSKLSTFLLWLLVRGYQLFVSSLFSGHCRHDPTCSQYALIAIENHAPIKSIWLIIKRILRCNPLGTSGFDPVPPHHNVKQEMNIQISGKCVAPGDAQGYIGQSNLSADPGK